MHPDDATFPAFVAAHRPALLRTALLLTGDRASAEALVQRTLTRARRRWRRLAATGDPAPAVRRDLVTAVTARRAGLLRAEQVLESLPAAAPWQDRELARALRQLPPRTRAVVVLRWHDGLSAAATAELLGCPVGTVTAEADSGLARLAAVLPAGGYERAPAAEGDETRLTGQLARLAAAPGPWQLDDAAAVTDVAGRRRASRLRLAGGITVAACAVGLLVPVARSLPDPAPAGAAAAPAAVGDASTTPPPIAPRSTPVLVGPTRGSLAGDPAFLDAVRRVGWGAQDAPPPDRRDVVFAGDTPAGRVVLLTGTVDEDFRGVWLTGPVGAPAEALALHVPPQLGRERPLTLVLGGPGPATLVVVAGREDRVEVSDRLKVGPRGTVGRTYETVEAPDGVAVVPVRTTRQGTATSVRVTREGRVVHRSGVDWPGAGGSVALPSPAPLRPAAVLPDDGLLAAALSALAVPLGVEPADLEPELLWSGAPRSGRPGTALVLLARSPGGALLVSTSVRAGTEVVPCGVATPPGTADVARLTVARVCGTGPGRWLVVSAPPEGVSAEVLDDRGRQVATVPLTGGGAVVPVPEGADTVRVLAADGDQVTGAPVAPMATDVFGDFGSGPQR